jgi:TM2 domain-containing membrane protein YozV
MARSPKSPGIAVLLEFLFAGTGAMYAEQVGTGVAWLVGTIIANVIASIVMVATLQHASQINYDPNYGYYYTHDYSAFYAVLVVVSLLSITWLIVRCVLASGYVRRYNAQLAGVFPSATTGYGAIRAFPQGPAVTTSRAVWTTVGLAAVSILVSFISFRPYLFLGLDWVLGFIYPGVMLAAAYWVTLILLHRVSWLPAAGAGILATIASGVIAIFVLSLSFDSRVGSLLYESSLSTMIYGVIIGLIGAGFAAMFARWHDVRTWRLPNTLQRDIGVIVGAILASLLIVTFLFDHIRFGYVLGLVFYSLVPILILSAASLLTFRALRRAQPTGSLPQ